MSNYKYFLKADLSKYSSEWIAIFNDKVVFHGSNFKEVAEMTDKEFKGKKVLITRVPSKIAQFL